MDDARSHARTHRKETVGWSVVLPPTAAASSPSSFRARAIPSFPLSPSPCVAVGQKRLVFNVTNAAAAAAPVQPAAAPPTRTDGSSSHYDAALYTSREATAAAAAVRNSCVSPVNILRWRPTVQEGVRGGDGEDETILSCRASRSDAT